MQFVTGVVTEDIEYLMYLMLKDNEKYSKEETETKSEEPKDEGYMKEGVLEDWFNSI